MMLQGFEEPAGVNGRVECDEFDRPKADGTAQWRQMGFLPTAATTFLGRGLTGPAGERSHYSVLKDCDGPLLQLDGLRRGDKTQNWGAITVRNTLIRDLFSGVFEGGCQPPGFGYVLSRMQ